MTRFTFSMLLVISTTGMVYANAGPPTYGGQVAGEPVGVRHIRIVRETLTIDLRPVARNEKVAVDVTYRLLNEGVQQSLDLLFASGSDQMMGFEVLFDGRSVTVAPGSATEVPVSWKAPKETPGFGDGRALEYAPGTRSHGIIKPVGFTLVVPPGSHTLVVRYGAAAATNMYGHPTVYRQFAYVLAPARAWAGFGGLDVTVHLPEGWAVVATPELTREGNTLHGNFESIPADSLAITLQAQPGPRYGTLIAITQGAFAVAGFGGLPLVWVVGRWRGRRAAVDARRARIWPYALLVGAVWSVGFLVAGLFVVYGPETALPEGQVNNYGYTQVFEMLGVILLSPTVAVIGFLIAYITGCLVRRMNLPHTAPSSGVS